MKPTSIQTFRAMHEQGCFLLPNPWDIGSARYLHHLGYQALATTSAGFAFTRGLPDSVHALSLEAVLAHTREIVEATPLPVNADFQNAYADAPEDVHANVAACIDTGVAGLSIEDSTGDDASPLYERDLAIERVRAACAARDAHEPGVVITARCEAWLVGAPEPKTTALERLVAFAEAGADCLYAPGVRDADTIAEIVGAVAPKPVNVLMWEPNPDLTVQRLADLGVRRISVGSAFARVAWGAFMESAESLVKTGSFDALAAGAPFVDLNRVFTED